MKERNITNIFFELIQIAIGTRDAVTFTHTLTSEEWKAVYDLSNKQALIGIIFLGISRLPEDKHPPIELYKEWYMICESIKNDNRRLDIAAQNISKKFKKNGFENTILKGQGIAQLYPEPLYRTSGDIDIWLKGEKKEIYRYIKKIRPHCTPVYHHIDFDISDEVDIEVHFTPSWMNNYFTNRTLQEYFKEQQDAQMQRTVTTAARVTLHAPDNNFNRIYILVHIYRHLFHEGIGLRQLLDYHAVLTQGFTSEERTATMHTLKKLKMGGFAAACMYVLKTVFATPDEMLLTAPDDKQGKFLLSEIMTAGNFGQFDERQSIPENEMLIATFFRRVRVAFRFLKYHPSEVLCSPLFKIWHLFWRHFYFR